jgi:hypothetical protein
VKGALGCLIRSGLKAAASKRDRHVLDPGQ